MLTYKVNGSFNCITTNTISNLSKNSKFFNNKNEKNSKMVKKNVKKYINTF